ncbi:phosphate-starvation-inducible PsiE family protein [Rubrobacter xylanophilus]|uniref:phosphate-starvation-inducible PsiE family protein n=1 Tax=Rubrobacter xylanophilus TaxID=49319 RepID=UPI00313B1E6E
MLRAPEAGLLDTALTILDRVLLIFIFVELLNTVEIVVREAEISAEPFILIGLIAVVRRILTVTAEIEQSLGTPAFEDLVLELGVLTLLVVALSGALFFTRRVASGD